MYLSGKSQESVYFEHQLNDQLCGLHCLNSLLQGPYFDEISLSQVGIELEKQERALLGNENVLVYLLIHQSDYENVGLDGNFNIQVIAGAMKQCCGAYLESVQKKENKNKEMT